MVCMVRFWREAYRVQDPEDRSRIRVGFVQFLHGPFKKDPEPLKGGLDILLPTVSLLHVSHLVVVLHV